MIRINGVEYGGNSISINNDNIVIDGKKIKVSEKQISIIVTGNIDTIDIDQCENIGVTGDVRTVKTMSGDVLVGGNVTGDIKTMAGDVTCADVSGKIKTMSGDIKR